MATNFEDLLVDVITKPRDLQLMRDFEVVKMLRSIVALYETMGLDQIPCDLSTAEMVEAVYHYEVFPEFRKNWDAVHASMSRQVLALLIELENNRK